MGQSVHGPNVGRLEPDGSPGFRFGPPVVTVLLQAEGVHALHVAPAGQALGPRREYPGRHVVQTEAVAEEEVQILGHLQGEEIAGVEEQGVLQGPGGSGPVSVGPSPGSAEVEALAAR